MGPSLEFNTYDIKEEVKDEDIKEEQSQAVKLQSEEVRKKEQIYKDDKILVQRKTKITEWSDFTKQPRSGENLTKTNIKPTTKRKRPYVVKEENYAEYKTEHIPKACKKPKL